MIQRYNPVGTFHGILNWNLRFSELRTDSDSSYLGRETELKSDSLIKEKKSFKYSGAIKPVLWLKTGWKGRLLEFKCTGFVGCCWIVRLGKRHTAFLNSTFMKMQRPCLTHLAMALYRCPQSHWYLSFGKMGFRLLFLNHRNSGTGWECTLRSTSWPRLEPPGKHYFFSLEIPFFMFLINLLY